MRTKSIGLTSVVAGVLFAGFSMYVAWQHNSQCEFHCEGVVYWGSWLLVGASWLVAGSVVTFIAVKCVCFLASKLASKLGFKGENT